MVTGVLVLTAEVVTLNVDRVAPLAKLVEVGANATAESSTMLAYMSIAPVIAGLLIVNLACEDVPPWTEVGFIVKPEMTGLGLIVMDAVFVSS